MSGVPTALRQTVLLRSQGRCEYCRLSQAAQEAAFHIDHIVPRAAGGPTTEDNLAVACVSCSLRKAAKQSGIDPESGEETPLYNPRAQKWVEHFLWDNEVIKGLTPVGRATILALKLNRALIVAIRREEMIRGRHPV